MIGGRVGWQSGAERGRNKVETKRLGGGMFERLEGGRYIRRWLHGCLSPFSGFSPPTLIHSDLSQRSS